MIENTLNSQKDVNQGLNYLSKKEKCLANLISMINDFPLPKRNSGFEAILKIIIRLKSDYLKIILTVQVMVI